MIKNSFVLYSEYKEQFELLTYEEAGKLIMAIFEYTESGNIPPLEGMTLMAFSFIKKQLDRDLDKYEKTIEKRREAGKSGGRPKANGFGEKAKKANAFSEKQTKAKKAVDVDVNEDVNDNEDVDVNVDVDEKEKEKEREEKKESAAAPTPTTDLTPLSEDKTKQKHKRGEYGWILLTDEQYQKLIDQYGPNTVDFYIRYIDESAQQTGNKNKWKDWNLTIRKAIRNKWGNGPPVNVQSAEKNYDDDEDFFRR